MLDEWKGVYVGGMNIFSRYTRRPDSPPERMIGRARVADLIGRSTSRTHRLMAQPDFPAPDNLDTEGNPLWWPSTIRAWWLSRGETIPDRSERYFTPAPNPPTRRPELLEDVWLQGSHEEAGRLRIPHELHVRVYAGMDDGRPVILIAAPKGDFRVMPHEWPNVRDYLARRLHTDVQDTASTWLTLEAGWDYSAKERTRLGYPPISTHLSDLETGTVITADEVAPLIGRPFDVWPREHYNRALVRQRAEAHAQDSEEPLIVVEDGHELGATLSAWRSLNAIENASLGVKWARQVLASRALSLNDSEISYARHLGKLSTEAPSYLLAEHDESVRAPVRVVGRTLSAYEHAQITPDALDEPLESGRELVTDKGQSRWQADAREDIRVILKAIRDDLFNPDLADDSPVRAALERAEALVAAVAREADADFARTDVPLTLIEAGREETVEAYLAAFTPVRGTGTARQWWTSLPRPLQRRAKLLWSNERAASWQDKTLLVNDERSLLALIGTQPTASSREAAEAMVARNRWHHSGYDPRAESESMSRTDELQVEALLRPTPRALMEWPRAALKPVGAKVFSRLTFRAPSTSYAVHRPAFVEGLARSVQPLPLTAGQPDGFVWGVSSTDTLTPALFTLLTDRSSRDWATFKDEAADPGLSAYTNLRRTARLAEGALRITGAQLLEGLAPETLEQL